MKKTSILGILLAFIFCAAAGCGYTSKSLLPEHIKKIHVDNFKNSIDVTVEPTEREIYKTYRPLLEVDVTKAVTDRYIFDGNLKISREKDADAILSGEVIDFKREALRYDEAENIEQYRIVVIVRIQLKDVKEGKMIWKYDSFAGSYEYYTSGSQAKSEDAAVTGAIQDLARRIVEQTIEVW